MNAVLIIKTKNGFAIAPYSGPVPAEFVENMRIATKISSYTYASDTLVAALEAEFEPPVVAETPTLKAV